MKDVIAPLYASLVLKIKESLLYSRAHDFNTNSAVFNQILKVFPCPEPHSPWDNISKQFFDIVKSEELLWSSANGGRFVPMHTGYLLLSDDSKQNTQAIHGITNCANQVDLDAKLEQFLQEEGIPVVTIPVTIGNVLLNYNYSAGKVCPTMVRAHFTANRSRFMQNLKSAADQSSALDKTRFWLQYCFSDVSPANFSDVIGLPFLPLENGLFGCFADPMESDSYFLVTDIERKLLHHAGQCIVAPDEVLGQHVVSCLRHKTFSDYCNVRQLAVVDSLKLINSLFPKSWLSSNVIFVDRNESVITANSDWLASLWSYIIEGKNIELFTEVLPIMPVVSLKLQDSNDSATITTSSGLVKVSSAIPVLHMIHKNATAPLATIGLACLGIFIFDDTVLGSISYSQEVASLLSLPDAKGIMFSLKKVINSHNFNSQQALRSCSAEVIIALQEFILDNVVSKLDNLTDDEKSVLRSIPVWFTHGSQLPTTLDLQSVKLAPRNSNKAILNNGFVSLLRGETDRLLYQKLSIPQATGGEFCMSHLIPLLREHKIEDTAAIDSLAVNILRNLTELESDCPGITQSLREVPMIRSNENKHVCASDLYDPASSILGGILSNDMFPNSQVYRDPTLIILLRVVGLNSTLNGDGIITAAKSIEYEFDRIRQGEDINVNSGSPEQLLNDLIYRAESLLRYLENNIDTIVHDLQQQQYLSNTSTAQEESSSQLVVEWGNKLRY